MENRLRILRAQHNLSQAKLAELLKVSRQTINAIEKGKYNPSLTLAIKISQLFGCPIEKIFFFAESLEKGAMSDRGYIFELEATKVRSWFAEKLEGISQIIAQSEQQAKEKGGSGKLALSTFINNLDEEVERLKNGKFRFLIIGDFNRGKSTILNAFFEQSLLPMGVTPTTAIPTFVKYGEQEKVLVHKKNGTEEQLDFEQFKKKYTLNSKQVKNQIKYIFKSLGEWLTPLDYAEFYCPIEVLSTGVEFIDTAGLNHTEEENQKTFSYISDSHAILFVLAADQQFTQTEQDYLKRLLGIKKEIENNETQPQLTQIKISSPESPNKKQTRPIFYLINKWEHVEEEDEKKEIHKDFVESFCKCLNINQNEAEKMWGDKVFDVYAKTALDNLKQRKSINSTGIKEFQKRLSDFLINERLITELLRTVNTAKFVATEVASKVDYRLLVLEDDVKTLEAKIEKTKPCIALMKKNAQILEENFTNQRNACMDKVAGEYYKYFSKLVMQFETEFEMPPVSSLKDNQREQYTQDLESRLREYRQEKLEIWHEKSMVIVSDVINVLKNSFMKEINDYEKQRNEIREILNQGNLNGQNQTGTSIYQSNSSEDISLEKADTNPMAKMFWGTIGSASLGLSGLVLGETAKWSLGWSMVGVALTPLGWSLLGGSVVVGGVLAWWARRKELQRFQKEMFERVKGAFKRLIEPDQVENIKGQVGQSFDTFEKLAKLIGEDAQSLENSLNNLLESKRTTKVNCEAEKKRLKVFVDNISAQLQIIEKRYEMIASVEIKGS